MILIWSSKCLIKQTYIDLPQRPLLIQESWTMSGLLSANYLRLQFGAKFSLQIASSNLNQTLWWPNGVQRMNAMKLNECAPDTQIDTYPFCTDLVEFIWNQYFHNANPNLIFKIYSRLSSSRSFRETFSQEDLSGRSLSKISWFN